MKLYLIIGILFLCFTGIIQAAGDLDPLFGNGGKVTTAFGVASDSCAAVILQPDGKIIAGGIKTTPQDFALARYNPNGSLDPTFGSGGKVTTDFFGQDDTLGDVKLLTDGKIIAAGITRPGPVDPMVIALARYNPNGTLDPTFGSGGMATASLANFNFIWPLVAMVIQSDGKIVVSGAASDMNDGAMDSFVARFNPNGSLDPTFGSGIVIIDVAAGNDTFNDVALQTDDKIVATGSVPGAGGQDHFDYSTVRLNPDGSLDPTFGSGGKVITNIAGGDDLGFAVLIQPDGKIVVAGEEESISPLQVDFGILRYNPNGSLDPTFGNGGIVTSDFSGGIDIPFAITLQPDGKIVAAGKAGPNFDFALARYNPNGSLDQTFGAGGEVVTDFVGLTDVVSDVLIQPDGKIIAAGFSDQGGNNGPDFALARYNGDIVLPSCGLYSDDFEDGVLAADWNYVKPAWTEVGGNLVGTPTGKKAEAIATPAFAGCGTGNCTIQTTIQTAGGVSNQIFFFGWYQDKQNLLEVQMKEENDKWVIKQIANGSVVAKTKASATILPNIFYDVRVSFDGTKFTLTVDGVDLVSMNAGATPSGTVGYRVKKTIGRFGNICAD